MSDIKKEQNGKVRRLFLKYFLKYFLILLIALAGSLLIVIRACQITERNIVKENVWKLERGVDELEDQMFRMSDMAETLRGAEGIQELARLDGSLATESYVELNYAKEQLRNATIMSDFTEMAFVLFRKNDCFVSEAQSADSFSQYYGKFLEAAGMDVEEFRKMLFSFRRKVNFISIPELLYSKYNKTEMEKNPILCVVYPSERENQNSSGEDASMAVVFIIREYTILDMMVSEGQMEKTALTLRYYKDEPFFQYEAAEDGQGKRKGSYREISATGMEEILHVDAKFSQNYLYGYVFELTGILLIYLAVGFAAAILLAIFWAGRQYQSMQGLISSVVPQYKGGERVKNEFDLLENSIQQLSQNRDAYRTKVTLMENQMKNSMLENAFSQGLYTEESRERFRQVFPVKIEYYCVAILNIRTEEAELRLRISMHARKCLERYPGEKRHFFSVLSGNGQEIYLILLDPSEPADIQEIADGIEWMQEELKKEYNMSFCSGLSAVGTGLENIKRCYNQALEALLTYEEEEGNVVATWHMLRHESAYRSPADLEAMQKLNQLILYGETEAASALFNHMLDQYRRNIPAFELRREEIFYAMRNILTGLLGQQIFESSSVRLPEYRRDQSFAELISGLKDAAVEMCREVEEKKKGRNEKLKKELLSWLKTNYADPSLTAARISRETGIAEKLLFQLIKEATGCTLAEYLENIRVNRAQELLLTTQLSNAEIAEKVGFGHVNTFYRVFSKRKGISPAKYRKNSADNVNGTK